MCKSVQSIWPAAAAEGKRKKKCIDTECRRKHYIYNSVVVIEKKKISEENFYYYYKKNSVWCMARSKCIYTNAERRCARMIRSCVSAEKKNRQPARSSCMRNEPNGKTSDEYNTQYSMHCAIALFPARLLMLQTRLIFFFKPQQKKYTELHHEIIHQKARHTNHAPSKWKGKHTEYIFINIYNII